MSGRTKNWIISIIMNTIELNCCWGIYWWNIAAEETDAWKTLQVIGKKKEVIPSINGKIWEKSRHKWSKWKWKPKRRELKSVTHILSCGKPWMCHYRRLSVVHKGSKAQINKVGKFITSWPRTSKVILRIRKNEITDHAGYSGNGNSYTPKCIKYKKL